MKDEFDDEMKGEIDHETMVRGEKWEKPLPKRWPRHLAEYEWQPQTILDSLVEH